MVECHLAKVDVEGSNPFSRSQSRNPARSYAAGFFVSDARAGSMHVRCVFKASNVASHRWPLYVAWSFLRAGWPARTRHGPQCSASANAALVSRSGLFMLIGLHGVSANQSANAVRDSSRRQNDIAKAKSFIVPNTLRLAVRPMTTSRISRSSRSLALDETPRPLSTSSRASGRRRWNSLASAAGKTTGSRVFSLTHKMSCRLPS